MIQRKSQKQSKAKQLQQYIQQNRRFDFGIESLESRQLLAGNVTAVITGAGDLVITGDDDSNNISVEIDTDGTVEIVGHAGTMVDADIMGAQVTGDIEIDLGDGDNVLNLEQFGSYAVADGGFDFSSGDGNDDITIDVSVTGHAKVAVGGGNDQLTLNLDTEGKKKNVTVSAVSGDNTLNLEDVSSFAGKVSVKTGSGVDTFYGYAYGKYSTSINSGKGDDAMDLSIGSWKKISVVTGDGDDILDIELSSLYGSSKIATSKGNDTVNLSGESKKVTVATSSGDDTVVVDNSYYDGDKVGAMKVALGGGNDSFTFGNNNENMNFKASGGGGTDEFIGDPMSPMLKLTSFELGDE